MALLAGVAPSHVELAGVKQWWGADIAEISVDVANIEDETRERLAVPGCCDRSCGLISRCCTCCILGVLVPVLLISTSTDIGNQIWREIAIIAGVVLFVFALVFCCFNMRHTCCEGIFNLPEPAQLVPPLSKNSQRVLAVKRALLIYNPNAGKRQAESILQGVVLPGLRKRGVECHVVATERVGHAREIGMTYDLRGFQVAVTLGGDGTFHELVNGLLARQDGQRVAVSLIPLGTGNGLAASLRQNMQRRGEEVSVWSELDAVLEWSLDRIAGGRLEAVDLLEVEVMNKRLVAIMQVYVGLLAELDLVAEPLRWMGPARFDLTAVWMILRKEAHVLECKLTFADGTTQSSNVSCIGASVGLCQHFDDKLRAVPQAQLDDGLVEFSSISSLATVDELMAGFLKLAHGAHTEDQAIWESKQVTAIELRFERPGLFNVDGEILEHDGLLRLRVLPQMMDMLVGKEESESAGPAEDTRHAPPWGADPKRWRMLGLYALGCMANQAMWIGFAPIEEDVKTSFGCSSTWVNLLSLVFMIVYLPANFPASYAMDVLGCRHALIMGGSLQMLGALLRCVQPVSPNSAYLVMAGQTLAAIGQPFFTDMPPKIAVDWFPPYQRVMADTIASLAMPIGAAVGFVLPAAFGLQNMLYVHLCWTAVALLLIVGTFHASPSRPPSPESSHRHAGKSFAKELKAALCNGRLWCLISSFACSLGSFNTLSTLAAQLVEPFNFDSNAASMFGVACTVGGVIGAAIMSIIVGLTGKHKPVLALCCINCVIFSALATLSAVYLGNSSTGFMVLLLAFAGLGFSATPLMPISFEAAVSVGHPTGEGTLAGLCMSGGQVLGISQTLIIGELLKNNRARTAWMLSGGLFVVALLAVSLFNPKKDAFTLPDESSECESRSDEASSVP